MTVKVNFDLRTHSTGGGGGGCVWWGGVGGLKDRIVNDASYDRGKKEKSWMLL